MVHLDHLLAQAIVDRSMKIIDCNVNVMDARGIIIASGDPVRLGTVHQGALLVLAKQAPVEIDEDLVQQLDGVRPGVNLPLRAEEQIVGCVGLTGLPQALRRYGALVQMAAETMLEQARLMQLLARDARLREELVLGLIRNETLTPAQIHWAERLGIDVALPRVAAVIEVDGGSLDVDSVLGELQRLHTLLTTPERDNLIATVSLTELVVLKPALNGKGDWDVNVHRQRVKSLLARMKSSSPLGVRLAFGQYFPGPGGLARSYQVALTTLAVGKQRQPNDSAFFYADLTLPVLLDGFRQGWQADEMCEPLSVLMKHDRHGQLLRTLKTWYSHEMKVADTAQALHIHRNTLDYRMRRIQEICGVNLSNTADCVHMYLALQMIDAV
ncbi:sugar diacid recognition domain-containing protein [Telmatospirillum sp.]|uniref:sugar diacid recognition domain-containing protein n=1 Tax=Telmatospirillum sp. TaxID=2079197 RepID=UPI002841591C|nr:sugar diacid recognition domain-containing protein [Telmatospirillum sp.]MDR3436508.1 sugar diacid recognition domain-containing protein [Telmatospirillum sp.]